MKKYIALACISSIVVASLLNTGCNDEVSQATVEEQRTIARGNSMFVAKDFVSNNPRYAGYQVVNNGDSTMSTSCPQGDGWASLELYHPEKKGIKIKCSTYSKGIGCMTQKNFEGKTYARQDKTCDRKLKYPLPKIAG